eukprot:CAMPEP_0177629990 /NCGR_PEP_ID=MMETSP0447-20121125/970_1 /TAXON_ID=0 /ORGANISM="Stygamoeba regulata, Strain BSH-02190019" /LENGTH=189 /DNA_ID=CAMNT_0019131363 /DNA_START=102 /DNA_END=667 /DNA_ORIENTATION=+
MSTDEDTSGEANRVWMTKVVHAVECVVRRVFTSHFAEKTGLVWVATVPAPENSRHLVENFQTINTALRTKLFQETFHGGDLQEFDITLLNFLLTDSEFGLTGKGLQCVRAIANFRNKVFHKTSWSEDDCLDALREVIHAVKVLQPPAARPAFRQGQTVLRLVQPHLGTIGTVHSCGVKLLVTWGGQERP